MKLFARHASAIALMLTTTPMIASAQYTEAQPGTRVRIEAPGVVAGKFEGTILSRDVEIVRIAAPNAIPVDVPMNRITSLEMSRGKSRWAGVGRGAVVGIPVGLVLGLIAASGDADTRAFWDAGQRDTLSRGEMVAFTTFASVLWGGVIGAFVPKERWEPFAVAPRTGFDPRSRRTHIGFALAR